MKTTLYIKNVTNNKYFDIVVRSIHLQSEKCNRYIFQTEETKTNFITKSCMAFNIKDFEINTVDGLNDLVIISNGDCYLPINFIKIHKHYTDKNTIVTGHTSQFTDSYSIYFYPSYPEILKQHFNKEDGCEVSKYNQCNYSYIENSDFSLCKTISIPTAYNVKFPKE